MAELKARFSLIDEMSDKLTSMAECGQNMIGQWENANNSINSTMENAASGASNVVSSLNAASSAMDGVNSSSSSAASGADAFSEAVNDLEVSVNSTTQASEQLAAASSQTADALSSESDIFSKCEQSSNKLNSEIETAVTIHDELKNTLDQSKLAMDEYANSGRLSSEAQNVLETSSRAVQTAMVDLELAQEDAQKAAEYYNAVIQSGTEDARAYEMAQSRLEKNMDNLAAAQNNAKEAAENFSGMINTLGITLSDTTSKVDYWTAAAQNYDKSALEAVYTTEQLVQMGLKFADALYTESDIFLQCEQALYGLNSEIKNAANVHEELAGTLEQASSKMEEYADNSSLSAEMQSELENTSKAAAQAMQELETAQNEAKAAMENYDNVIMSGTTDTSALESAQNQAAQAAANLTAAEDNAKKAVGDFSKASDEAGKSTEENGKKGINAVEALASTVVAAKIADEVRDITKATYELADAFSEAEKVVVNATGASGESLAGLEQSMMNAYSGHHQDLNTTAGAIGEINTRMALTGNKLTDVTGLFLDYASITGSDVVGSVQNVTKVMNQWGVEMDDVESVLDKLAYAGQISGISVDNLSSTLITGAASFQEVGLSLDSTIQLLADFELAGINSGTAIMAMRTAVNSFSKDGLDAKTALQSTITEIQQMGDSSEATAKAVEVFGSRAGQQLAAAIRNGTVSVESFSTSLESADGTLRKTAEAGETLGEKWDKSSNKIKAAFTSAIQPTIDKFSSGFAEINGKIGDFLSENPIVVKGLSVLGIGLGAAALGVAGVAAASLTAIPAVAAFGTAFQTALGPIGWISLGVTAVTGVVMALSGAFSDSENQIKDYNGSLEECAAEIDRTKAEYDSVCKMYGENKDAAQRLSDELDNLNAQYAKGGGAAADYAQRLSESKDAFASLKSEYNDNLKIVNDDWQSGMIASAQLKTLSQKMQITNTDLDMMSKYADYLNDTFNCNIEVNYDTKSLTGFDPTDINSQMEKIVQDKRKQAASDYITGDEFTNKYIDTYRNYQEAVQKLTELETEIEKAASDPGYINTTGWKFNDYEKFTNEVAGYENTLKGCNNEIMQSYSQMGYGAEEAEDYIDILKGISSASDDAKDSAEDLVETMTKQEILAEVGDRYKEQIEELCVAYDEAYNAAYESFQGQFGLFDEASMKSEAYTNSTVANAQAALDSQLAYWTEYGNNIDFLSSKSAADLGLTQANYDALMSYVQSGSEEAAGLAANMVAQIEQGNTEAVTKLGETIAEVDSKQSEIAGEVADWQTDFSHQMEEMLTNMQGTVDDIVVGMDFSDGADVAAKNSLAVYANQIKSSGESAVENARSIAKQVISALSINADVNIGVSGSVPGHATGTTNAEDIFVAGEEGPELIVGKAGSTVFPASETNRIISAVAGLDPVNYMSSNSYLTAQNSANYQTINNIENTEIFNNYSSAGVQGYDDSEIISCLKEFNDTFSKIINISLLDDLIRKCQTCESTVYGDTVSNFYDSVNEYGDTIKNFTESVNNDYSRQIESALNYGDSNYDESTVYGDIQTIDNSRKYESIINYNSDNRIADEGREYYLPSVESSERHINSESVSTKKIIIEIGGNGNIELTGGVDKEQVLEIIRDNMMPVLAKIVSQEMFEEGESSYET